MIRNILGLIDLNNGKTFDIFASIMCYLVIFPGFLTIAYFLIH